MEHIERSKRDWYLVGGTMYPEVSQSEGWLPGAST